MEKNHFHETVAAELADVYKWILILFGIGIIVEIIFVIILASNWKRKQSPLKSAFFYLLTMKTLNDVLNNATIIVDNRFPQQMINLGRVFLIIQAFVTEFDTMCHLCIAINRYTAFMMPTKQEEVSGGKERIL